MGHSGSQDMDRFLSPHAGIYSREDIMKGSLPSLAFAPGELGDLSLFPDMPPMQHPTALEDEIDANFARETGQVSSNGRIEGGIYEPEYYEYSPQRKDTWEDGAQAIEDFDWPSPVGGGESEHVPQPLEQAPVTGAGSGRGQAAVDIDTAQSQLTATPTSPRGKGKQPQQDLLSKSPSSPLVSEAPPVTPRTVPTHVHTIQRPNSEKNNVEHNADQNKSPSSYSNDSNAHSASTVGIAVRDGDIMMMDSSLTSRAAQDHEELTIVPVSPTAGPSEHAKQSNSSSTHGLLPVMPPPGLTPMEIDSDEQIHDAKSDTFVQPSTSSSSNSALPEATDSNLKGTLPGLNLSMFDYPSSMTDETECPPRSGAGNTDALPVSSAAIISSGLQQQECQKSLQEQLQQAVYDSEIKKELLEPNVLTTTTSSQDSRVHGDKDEYSPQSHKLNKLQEGPCPTEPDRPTPTPSSIALVPRNSNSSNEESSDEMTDPEQVKLPKHILSNISDAEAGAPAKKKQKHQSSAASSVSEGVSYAAEEHNATNAGQVDKINVLIKAQENLSLTGTNEASSNIADTNDQGLDVVKPGQEDSDIDMQEQFSDEAESPALQSPRKAKDDSRVRKSMSSRELLSLASTLTPSMHLTLQQHASGDAKRSRKLPNSRWNPAPIDSSEPSVGSDESEKDERQDAVKKQKAPAKNKRKLLSREQLKSTARKPVSVPRKKLGKKEVSEEDSDADELFFEPKTQPKRPGQPRKSRSRRAPPTNLQLKPAPKGKKSIPHEESFLSDDEISETTKPTPSSSSLAPKKTPASQPTPLHRNKYGFMTRSPVPHSSPLSAFPPSASSRVTKKTGTAARSRNKTTALEPDRRTTRRASAVEDEIRRQSEKEENIGRRLRSRDGEGGGK